MGGILFPLDLCQWNIGLPFPIAYTPFVSSLYLFVQLVLLYTFHPSLTVLIRSIVIRMEFRFILVEPSVPENVGSVARALKTLGFHSLALVNSQAHKEEKARWVAHGSWEILEQATVYPTVNEAVQDLDFVVATTARRRTLNHDYHTPRELRKLLLEKEGVAHRVGLLLGREESGLTNEELAVAHCVSSIPLAGTYPSLNLAQAVLVYAYELSPVQTGESRDRTQKDRPQSDSQQRELTYLALRSRVQWILEHIGLGGENLVGKRLVERMALLSDSDLRLLHSLCARVEKVFALQEERKG
jgi:tRNA/rRNA methyltransferase